MENSRSVSDPLPNLGLNTLDDRDALLIGLIADARRLARSRIGLDRPLHGDAQVICYSCYTVQSREGWLDHGPACLVGAIMARLAALKKLTLERNPGPSATDLDCVAEDMRIAAATAGPVDQPDGSCYEDPSPLRCRSCFNLRHSTPRHKPNCPCASQNCPGCIYAGESHLASCPVGVQLKQAGDDCCEGVDLPRFGLVHSFDCPVGDRPVIRASREYVAVEGGGR